MIRNKELALLVFVLFSFLAFVINSVSAEWVDCWQYGPMDANDPNVCSSNGCIVTSLTGSVDSSYGYTGEVVQDLWCGTDMSYCCLPKECWLWDETNQTLCEENDGTLNCTWNGFPSTMYLPNGSEYTMNGTCNMDWDSMGEDIWGGVSDGCWQYDGDKQQCISNYQKCEWKPNDANQNPWCWIKNLQDAQAQNPLADSDDIGCCDMKGCWSYDGNETRCLTDPSFAGLCTFVNKTDDPWCPDPVGCCYTKSCSEVGSNQTLCNLLKKQMMMPCEFNATGDGTCGDFGGSGGGFAFFNDTDSCMQQGGWYDINGNCMMPNMTDVGGAFMFGGEAHCWFADNQPFVCGNITGCVYCVAGSGPNGVENCTDGDGNGYSDNICCGKQVGFCEGHNFWDNEMNYSNSDDSTNLNCTHIKIKSACKYGPLPNCIWSNSTALIGEYCNPGTSTEAKDAPPVPFCEHPDAKNNETMCNNLAINYMMPCKWYENYTNVNGVMVVNCSFNPNAVFGSESNAEKDFLVINSEYSCIAAGGTWQTSYYIENNILKQDSWCEKGALFDPLAGQAAGNKGNCDMDCWACEFRYNGSRWDNATQAESACVGSALGYCRWTNDTNAPNQQGWCDYPQEMTYGAGDCNINCKDCDLKLDAYDACINSQAECKWVNNTNSNGEFLSTGYCVSKDKKTCLDDCFSCYSENDCFASTLDCLWDTTAKLCKPNSFSGEICFDAVDNDNDGFTDCADPDCSFDNACGGNNFADCMSITNATVCNATVAFGNLNCTWYNFTWEPEGHCGMPGEDCWQYDGDPATCGATPGCTNESSFGGSSGFCDINTTQMDNAQCWQYGDNETYCSAQANCGWVNDSWCTEHPEDSWCATGPGGWCDYKLFADCRALDGNQTGCGLNPNCTWHQDEWMDTGFCDPACFDWTLNSTTCVQGNLSGICEWRDSSDMCMPSTFDIMAGGSGGKIGCPQYDGNMTGCQLKNITCVWVNDSNVDNRVTTNVAGQNISGWCNDKGTYEMVGDMKGEPIMLGMDSGNMMGGAESGVVGWADIKGFGLRVTDKSYGFGVGIYNLTDGAVCNGYQMKFAELGVDGATGAGQNITKMRWYLDTDGDSSFGSHCGATDSNGASCDSSSSNLCNYEFYIDYMVRNNTNTGNIETTKKLYYCVMNGSTGWQWAPTNVFVTDDKKFTCWDSGMGALLVSIEKEAFENFALFDITQPMRIFVVSFDGPGSGDGADELGPSYYTPGTIDFGFVDCSDPNTKDPKCKNFQKFGTQVFEDCKNGYDDDSDGYADCADAKCTFTPVCASGTAFNWTSQCSSDYKAPVVVFTNVDKMADSAIIQYDTDEPANGSLIWYNTSSTCEIANGTVDDIGDVNFGFDDYKPFHRGIFDSDTLGYSLINNTNYYYKMKVCDPCGNCGTSACLNFTTKKENKPFIFKMKLPEGYSVNITSSDGTNIYSGNFTTTIGGTTYDIGVKTNSSVSKNMNITVHYGDLSMKFVGADLYKPKVLNMENAFIADTTNNVLGMNSSTKAWNFLLSDLGMGGSGDSLELNFPVAYSAGNTLKWTADDGTNVSDVTSYTSCSDGGNSNTLCKIPTSLGFSQYYLQTTSSSPDSSPSSGGGSSGGAAGGALYIISDAQFETGYTRSLFVNDRVQFNVGTEAHTITIDEISNETNTIKITVNSVPQTATLAVGDIRRFELNGDSYYDVSVTLNSITGNFADVMIKKISEEVTSETEEQEKEKEERAREQAEGGFGSERGISKGYIIAGIILITIVFLVFLGKKFKEMHEKRFNSRVKVLKRGFDLSKPFLIKNNKKGRKKKK